MRPGGRVSLVVGLLAFAASTFSIAWPVEIPPRPAGRVSDYAGKLRADERERIGRRLEAIEEATSNQIAVAIFPSLDGEDPADFSNRLFDLWKLGTAKSNNGVLLAIFLAERRSRIEVGYGLEASLPDAMASRILAEVLAPRLRRGDWAGGVEATVDAIDSATRGEYKPPRRPNRKSTVLPLVFVVLVLVAFGVTGALRGSGGGRIAGRRRGFRGPFDPGMGGWGGRWSGGGFGGGGFGGGGFSGGGGMSGGGGASGSW